MELKSLQPNDYIDEDYVFTKLNGEACFILEHEAYLLISASVTYIICLIVNNFFQFSVSGFNFFEALISSSFAFLHVTTKVFMVEFFPHTICVVFFGHSMGDSAASATVRECHLWSLNRITSHISASTACR